MSVSSRSPTTRLPLRARVPRGGQEQRRLGLADHHVGPPVRARSPAPRPGPVARQRRRAASAGSGRCWWRPSGRRPGSPRTPRPGAPSRPPARSPARPRPAGRRPVDGRQARRRNLVAQRLAPTTSTGGPGGKRSAEQLPPRPRPRSAPPGSAPAPRSGQQLGHLGGAARGVVGRERIGLPAPRSRANASGAPATGRSPR